MTFDVIFVEPDDGTRMVSQFRSKTAYVTVANRRPNSNPKLAEEILLTQESITAKECNAQIDQLIEDLKKLKQKTAAGFQKGI